MTIQFINRVDELKRLDALKRVTVIFGRRRVGKTALVKKWAADKNTIYLLAINKPLSFNLKRFSEQLSQKFNVPGLHFANFKEMFRFIEKQQLEILVIDEFGYLIAQGILPEFQEILDEVLTRKLVLTGSSISLMETEILAYKSPVYGRVDTIMHLLPLKFSNVLEWFAGQPFEHIVKIYAAVGGTPRYLEFFNAQQPETEIKANFFNQSFLFYDSRKIIEEELREPNRYFMILEAIARGHNTLNEIKNFTGLEYNKISFYVNKLKRLKIISVKHPLILPKKSYYSINDNYFKFWFRFVYPYEEEIDSLMPENALYDFDKWFNTYLGYIFEDIVMEAVRKKFPFYKTGTQFGPIPSKIKKNSEDNSYEIDIVAINEEKQILFGECKWSEGVNAERVAKKMEVRAEYVTWKKRERQETYLVFAKSFYKRINEWNGKTVYCFDLKEIEELLKNPIV
jgi:AAA+ ATPase superfamily predicted ATPase